jgi:hypothetical protein
MKKITFKLLKILALPALVINGLFALILAILGAPIGLLFYSLTWAVEKVKKLNDALSRL